MSKQWGETFFNVNEECFAEMALEAFHYQYNLNSIYHDFVDSLRVVPGDIDSIEKIPFLPINFFKTNEVKTTAFEPVAVFESSGTTKTTSSKHYIKDLSIYRTSFTKGFERFYRSASEFCIIGLLPSYLERENSSLVFMVDELIKQSAHPKSGFYLHELNQLFALLNRMEKEKQPTLLIGVTFALVDFAEKFSMKLDHTIVMETGGMKGRRKEITRAELHDFLRSRLGLQSVHAEYGMTELLSQAYSKADGVFNCPSWMKVLIRDEDDPMEVRGEGDGLINVIDLANIYSCSFIATDDAGRLHKGGSFEVLGRMDNSDLRGCSLLTI